MMVELKNGETYSGVLGACDGFMNLHMRDVVCTSRDGDRFWKIAECYIRGNNVKYIRLPDEVIDMVKEDTRRDPRDKAAAGRGRGRGRGRGFGGTGRGRGGVGTKPRGGGGTGTIGKQGMQGWVAGDRGGAELHTQMN
eukprot:GHVQ01009199.1.p1 GENE.GHVQ01009199.1~~GHVQ01009199.1.p1  ORF type:complete len:138 (+),score=26.66 GHVQ01009199.1:303-716(+)